MEYIPETRRPAVSGYFYPSDPDELKKLIEWCFAHKVGPGRLPKVSVTRVRRSTGFVVPHAGYVYSGPVAAHSYYVLAEEGAPETIIIIGPNHTGFGALVSVYPRGKWATPFGEIEVDEKLARAIVSNSNYAELDVNAHVEEHSVEVQLPFIQYLFGDKIRIVPIVLGIQTPEVAKDLARSILDAEVSLRRDVVILASTDFTHYEPHEQAMKKDLEAIKTLIETLDTSKFYEIIRNLNVTACGPGGVMTLAEYTRLKYRERGAAKLLKYATSGDTSGDKTAVVGYAAIQFYSK